ncbi:NAD(P)/FAD-dependent oxidoreductase [Streptomyces asiaticus]
MRVLVIGAGAIGLSCAYFLARRGATVTVADPRGPGGGASRRNAGWVVPSMSAPVPAPGTVVKSLRWTLRRDSPVHIRPSLDPAFARFMTAMLRRCNRADYAHGLHVTAELNRRTLELFDLLRADGVDFEHHRTGLLLAFLTEKSLHQHAEELAGLTRYGTPAPEVLSAGEARHTEPALSDAIVGAIRCPGEQHLDPDSFVDQLAAACRDRGVTFLREEVTDLDERDGTRIGAATGPGDTALRADAFVIAGGAWTPRLTGPLGFRLPLQAGKGYGFDFRPAPVRLRTATYLSEAKVAVTPLTSGIRLAGTMEFTGLDENVDTVRAGAIADSAGRYFRTWDTTAARPRAWAGLRPMTPDGLPAIGPVPGYDNVLVAAGHAMLGITLAPVTGHLVQRMLLDGTVPPEVEPFLPDRFA